MEDFQKQFLLLKGSINQKSSIFLNSKEYFTFNISEDLRDKIKRFWSNLPIEDQVSMFLNDNRRGCKMVTDALRSFGSTYFSAKSKLDDLSQIDKAIIEKTYFSSEILPGFESKLAMTQLFCNGRDSNGAYRIQNFFFLLPSHEFEHQVETKDEEKIGVILQNFDTDSGSKDAMYCLKLLKEAYGEIELKYFKMGVFLGDYLPDNLWSAWRYLNCKEFTLGETTVIPMAMYDTFIDNVSNYFKMFVMKLQPSLLTELWKTNISIVIFSTLFENNLILAFFTKNPKMATRYGFTPSCDTVQRRTKKSSEKHSIGGSSQNSQSHSGSSSCFYGQNEKLIANELNTSIDQTGSISDEKDSYHSWSLYSTSNAADQQQTRSTGVGDGIGLKKHLLRPPLRLSKPETCQIPIVDKEFGDGLFSPKQAFSSTKQPKQKRLRAFDQFGEQLQMASKPTTYWDPDILDFEVETDQPPSYESIKSNPKVKRFYLRRNLVIFHYQKKPSKQGLSLDDEKLDALIISIFGSLRQLDDPSESMKTIPEETYQKPMIKEAISPEAKNNQDSKNIHVCDSKLQIGTPSLDKDSYYEGILVSDFANSTSKKGQRYNNRKKSNRNQESEESEESSSEKNQSDRKGKVLNQKESEISRSIGELQVAEWSPKETFKFMMKKKILISVPHGFDLHLPLPSTKLDFSCLPPRFAKFHQ